MYFGVTVGYPHPESSWFELDWTAYVNWIKPATLKFLGT